MRLEPHVFHAQPKSKPIFHRLERYGNSQALELNDKGMCALVRRVKASVNCSCGAHTFTQVRALRCALRAPSLQICALVRRASYVCCGSAECRCPGAPAPPHLRAPGANVRMPPKTRFVPPWFHPSPPVQGRMTRCSGTARTAGRRHTLLALEPRGKRQLRRE